MSSAYTEFERLAPSSLSTVEARRVAQIEEPPTGWRRLHKLLRLGTRDHFTVIDEYDFVLEKYGHQISDIRTADENSLEIANAAKGIQGARDIEVIRLVYKRLLGRELKRTLLSNVKYQLIDNIEMLRKPLRKFYEGMGWWSVPLWLEKFYLTATENDEKERPWVLVKDVAWFSLLMNSREKAKHACDEARRLFRGQPLGELSCDIVEGFWYQHSPESKSSDQARQCYTKALESARKLQNSSAEARIGCHLAALFIDGNDPGNALREAINALQVAEQVGDPQLFAVCYTRIGLCYLKLGQLENALANLLDGSVYADDLSVLQYGKCHLYLSHAFEGLALQDSNKRDSYIVRAFRKARKALSAFAQIDGTGGSGERNWVTLTVKQIRKLENQLPDDHADLEAEMLPAEFNTFDFENPRTRHVKL